MRLNRWQTLYNTAPRLGRAGVWAAIGAVAALGQAPFGLSLLSFVGFTAVFLALRTLWSRVHHFGAGWWFGLGFFLVNLSWLVSPFLVEPEKHGWMAPFGLLAMCSFLALFWALAFWLSGKLDRPVSLVFTLPMAELARSYVFTGFAWGLPAYGFVDSLGIFAVTWFGSHGFNILLMISAWAMSFAIWGCGKRRIIASVIAGLALVAIVLPMPAPKEAPENAPVVRVIQPNAPQDEKWDPDLMLGFYDRALNFTRAPADPPPDLIVWPESSLPDVLNYASDLTAEIFAAAGGAAVVVGVNRFDGPKIHNSAVLLGQGGATIATYDKHHLVPFGEYMPFGDFLARFGIRNLAPSHGQGFSAGDGPALMDLGDIGRALPLICYEAVFPQDVRSNQERPDFLLHITNDAWFGNFSGPYQHLVQTQMRALETGLPLVRSANTGVSAMIDARGRIVAQLPLNEAGYLDVPLQAAELQTLYAWAGDAPILVFLVVALALSAAFRPRKLA